MAGFQVAKSRGITNTSGGKRQPVGLDCRHFFYKTGQHITAHPKFKEILLRARDMHALML